MNRVKRVINTYQFNLRILSINKVCDQHNPVSNGAKSIIL